MNIICYYCFESMPYAKKVWITPCGHMYHFQCIQPWVKRNRNCPKCRRQCQVSWLRKVSPYFRKPDVQTTIKIRKIKTKYANHNYWRPVKTISTTTTTVNVPAGQSGYTPPGHQMVIANNGFTPYWSTYQPVPFAPAPYCYPYPSYGPKPYRRAALPRPAYRYD